MHEQSSAASSGCVFCDVVVGAAPAWRLYEDERAVAFLDIEPATRGHTLVVSRRHVEDLAAIDEQDAAAVMIAVKRVSALLMGELGSAGTNVLQANGEAAWQTVFHYYVHVIPRYPGDGMVRPWRAARASAEELELLHVQLTRPSSTG